jgi:hypothetical protein
VPRASVSPAIREISRQLGVVVPGGADPTPKIVAACLVKVRMWCEQLGPVSSFDDLVAIAAAKLKVHFEVLKSDEDLRATERRHLEAGETGFLNLAKEFDEYTDAVVIRLQQAPIWSDRQYVAVIDSRGSKSSREWFSKWHELAHLIAEPQTKFVFRRTQTTRRDPVERLMDQIAGELAFYSDLFLPLLKRHRLDLTMPSLTALVNFHDVAFPFASVQATLIAVLRHSSTPCVLIEAKKELKASEQRGRSQGVLFSEMVPEPLLRAVTTAHNTEAIRRKFYVHRWMRVPDQSVIRHVYDGDSTRERVPVKENLSWWESQGERLADCPIVVEAMRAGSGRVLALVTKPE